MENDNLNKALEAQEKTEDELVIEVMRGDNEKSADDSSYDHNPTQRVKTIIENITSESVFKRLIRVYRQHFKGRFLRILGALVVVSMVAVIVFNTIVNRNFTVSFYQLRSDKVSDNIRIIVLADLHNREYGKKNSKLIDKIKALHPDLIVYAGDMMNYKNSDYSVLFDLSDKLSVIAPIYACYGNHEIDQWLFRDKTFTSQLEEHNVTLLSNEAMEVTVGRTTMQLIAISDGVEQFDVPTNNAKRFLETLEPTNECRICLVHFPEMFLEKLQNRGIDIAFCGHAHGGLIRLPKIGGLYSPGEGLFPTLTAGVNEMEDGTQVIISRGLGTSGILPRINNQPELVVADICWY